MAKKLYLAMTPFAAGVVHFEGVDVVMQLPEGCTHIVSVWKTKKAARAWFERKNILFMEVEEIQTKNQLEKIDNVPF